MSMPGVGRARRIGVPKDASPEQTRERGALRGWRGWTSCPRHNGSRRCCCWKASRVPRFGSATGAMRCFAREVALGKEVEQFAADFFSIPPAQRQERWRELTAACAFSRPLAVWLQALSGGLSVVPPQLQDTGRLRELADYVCRNFTKRPTARIAVDEVLLRHAAYAPKEWQDAALRLRQSYAQIAGLAPHLVAHLSEYVSFCKKEEKAEEKRKRSASAKAAWTFPQLSGSRNYVWLIWVVVMVLSGVLRREFRQ